MSAKPLFLLSVLMASAGLLEAASSCAPSCAVASIGEKVRVPWDCTKYSVCADAHGTGVLWPSEATSCPDEQYFDGLHVPPQCNPIAGAPPGFCQNTCSPCEPLWTFPADTTPHPEDCNAYYICLTDNQFATARCDGPTAPYYDYVNGGCSADETVCFNFCDTCEPYCLAQGNIADPTNCTYLYYCSPPELTHVKCPVGENYDATTGECSATAPCVEC